MSLERFVNLCQRIGIKDNPALIYEDILNTYQSKDRHYHNLSHIMQCLSEFDKVKHLAKNPDAVEYAIWFHDFVYDISRTDNESKSSYEALTHLCKNRIRKRFMEEVVGLIQITKHDKAPKTIDEKIILDVDLSILGQPSEIYNIYKENIVKEYALKIEEIGMDEFLKKRKEILKSFLARNPVYYTDFYKNLYNKQAKANLLTEILSIELMTDNL